VNPEASLKESDVSGTDSAPGVRWTPPRSGRVAPAGDKARWEDRPVRRWSGPRNSIAPRSVVPSGTRRDAGAAPWKAIARIGRASWASSAAPTALQPTRSSVAFRLMSE